MCSELEGAMGSTLIGNLPNLISLAVLLALLVFEWILQVFMHKQRIVIPRWIERITLLTLYVGFGIIFDSPITAIVGFILGFLLTARLRTKRLRTQRLQTQEE